jgi:unsaturated rhamnogalacturonyl hydrolase
MAESIKELQQPKGYWSRSLMDATYAPGCETSGTALFAYVFL